MNLFLFLGEWLVRSFALILAGALVLWLLRVKSPSFRLAAWSFLLAASFALPLLRSALPQLPLMVRRTAAPAAATAASATVPALATSDDITPAAPMPRALAGPFDWMDFAAVCYALVAALLMARLLIGLGLSLRVIRRSRATGIASDGAQARESDGVLSPVTAGIFWPVILLPADWCDWPSAILDAVLALERSHMRRRDSAVQFLSAIHRSLLWASPASWILDRGLVRAAEELSDDDAVSATGDRVSYAELLLEFSQRASGQSNWVMVMARRQRPEKRIRRVLNSNAIPRQLTRWSFAATLALGAPIAYLAAAAHPQSVPMPAAPRPTARPEFVVTSIKPNKTGCCVSGGGGNGGSSNRDVTLKMLIATAYRVQEFQISGGLKWISSDRFDVEGKAEDPKASFDQLRLMLQSLLEDRFRLKVHRETKPSSVYALVVANGGPKIKRSEDQISPDVNGPAPPGAGPNRGAIRLGAGVLIGNAVTMHLFVRFLSQSLDRLTIDKTNLDGRFDIRLEWAPAPGENTLGRPRTIIGVTGETITADPSGPSIFTAVQEQLGLRLESTRAPVDVLVIDHAEQPSAN
jgi:uncharacterized protein (TIGR03435 family)